ncbi:MAG: thermonuclease family protein [Pseudomonadota bacterium]
MAVSTKRRRRLPFWTYLLGAAALVLTFAEGLTRWPPSDPSAAAATSPSLAATHGELRGAARIIDGDTFDLAGARIRLWGVDAPERRQRCEAGEPGPLATAALAQIIAGRDVSCTPRDTDRYGRTVAACRAGGRDLGADMVSEGWAWDYTHYSGGHYRAEERSARDAGRGVWAMGCAPAWQWRHGGG